MHGGGSGGGQGSYHGGVHGVVVATQHTHSGTHVL